MIGNVVYFFQTESKLISLYARERILRKRYGSLFQNGNELRFKDTEEIERMIEIDISYFPSTFELDFNYKNYESIENISGTL